MKDGELQEIQEIFYRWVMQNPRASLGETMRAQWDIIYDYGKVQGLCNADDIILEHRKQHRKGNNIWTALKAVQDKVFAMHQALERRI